MGCVMFFTREMNTFSAALEIYRPCFSKPQWVHFNTYLTGLLLGEKGEKNIQDIAGNLLDGGHQSSLNRFITKHRWDLRQLNAIRLKECLHERTGGILSIDDTLIEKTGKAMGGVGYLYDSVQKKNILCHDIVSTFYRGSSTEQLPLYFEPYVKQEIAENSNIWFRTKIQIALDLLRQSLAQVTPAAIVFDEWYMSQEITEFINDRGLTWVSQAKTNRCVQVGEAWSGLATYARSLPLEVFTKVNAEVDEKRFKWFFETTVMMKKVGVVKLVVLRPRRNSKKFTFLVSNATTLSGMQVLEYYKKRWAIEVFHRDCKQHLGLGDYQIRKLDCVVIHLHLVFLAYTLLKNVQGNPVLARIVAGTKSIGAACQRLKRWMFERLKERVHFVRPCA
ncbi:MAG: IS701 family transposase [Candidatus Thermoplasmatota archaeon]